MMTVEEFREAYRQRMGKAGYRVLDPEEIDTFIKWADENEPTVSLVELVHPIVIWRWQEKGKLPE